MTLEDHLSEEQKSRILNDVERERRKRLVIGLYEEFIPKGRVVFGETEVFFEAGSETLHALADVDRSAFLRLAEHSWRGGRINQKTLVALAHADWEQYLNICKEVERKESKIIKERDKDYYTSPHDKAAVIAVIQSAAELAGKDIAHFLHWHHFCHRFCHDSYEIRDVIGGLVSCLAPIDKKLFIETYTHNLAANSFQSRSFTQSLRALASIDVGEFLRLYHLVMSKDGENVSVRKEGAITALGGLAEVDPEKYLSFFEGFSRSKNVGARDAIDETLPDLARVFPDRFVQLIWAEIQNRGCHISVNAINALRELATSRPDEFLSISKELIFKSVNSKDVDYDMNGWQPPDEIADLLGLVANIDLDKFSILHKAVIEHYMTNSFLFSASASIASIESKLHQDDKFLTQLYEKGMNSPILARRAGTGKALHALACIDTDRYYTLFRKGISDACHCYHRVSAAEIADSPRLTNLTKSDPPRYPSHSGAICTAFEAARSIGGLALTLRLPKLMPIRDDEQTFLEMYLDSGYAIQDSTHGPRGGITAELKGLIARKDIDYKKLKHITTAGKTKKLDELIECASITIPNYLPLKRLGTGAIKTAYLARNIHSGDESALLMIDPTSKGFAHYENIFRQQLEKQGVHMTDGEFREWTLQKMYTAEFSGVRLRNLEDPRYIALISPPIVGKDKHGNDVYFLETKPYDHTLEDELKNGPLPKDKALKYTYQLALALQNCHAAGIVHKDLKPDNIGITKEGNIVLSDFGCVSVFSTAGDTRYQYPLILRPPELAHPDEYWEEHGVQLQSDLFTPEANVWTFGMILYRMATGKNLIEGPEQRAKHGTEEYHQQNERAYRQIHDFQAIQEKIEEMMSPSDKINEYTMSKALLQDPIRWCLEMDLSRRDSALARILIRSGELSPQEQSKQLFRHIERQVGYRK
ncbi:protein kinase [Candidatus Woesearchaeota archaeon]|nr:protein kinase [Candidatus Woesearchaeota archaeon]